MRLPEEHEPVAARSLEAPAPVRVPILTRTQERALAQQAEAGDRRAREALIVANVRLVSWAARRYRPKHVPLEDAIQEGTIGLILAVDGFDWRRGYRLSTYALWKIRERIQRNSHRAQNLPSEHHDVAITSLDRQLGDGEETFAALVADGVDIVEEVNTRLEHEALRAALGALAPRTRDVLVLRFGLAGDRPRSLGEIGRRLGISRQRVHQLEQAGLKLLARTGGLVEALGRASRGMRDGIRGLSPIAIELVRSSAVGSVGGTVSATAVAVTTVVTCVTPLPLAPTLAPEPGSAPPIRLEAPGAPEAQNGLGRPVAPDAIRTHLQVVEPPSADATDSSTYVTSIPTDGPVPTDGAPPTAISASPSPSSAGASQQPAEATEPPGTSETTIQTGHLGGTEAIPADGAAALTGPGPAPAHEPTRESVSATPGQTAITVPSTISPENAQLGSTPGDSREGRGHKTATQVDALVTGSAAAAVVDVPAETPGLGELSTGPPTESPGTDEPPSVTPGTAPAVLVGSNQGGPGDTGA